MVFATGRTASRRVRLSICLAAVALCALGVRGVAHAQSAFDAFDPGANGAVNAVAVQADGKILVGGSFTMLGGGGTGATVRNRIGRLNIDGSLDGSFDPGANGDVRTLAVQADGKILVGGAFTTLGGGGAGSTTRNFIGRLNADGSVDATFNPGVNAPVNTVAVQADGRILIGGQFSTLGGGGTGTTPRLRVGRLNADGTLDPTFDPGANGNVGALFVEPRGKILIGGQFTGLGGGTGSTPRSRIGRLNPDGSLDAGFDPGANGDVWAFAVRPDGRVLVGGAFTSLGGGGTGTIRPRLGQLNADGSLDGTFDVTANDVVYALALQPDGKAIVAGNFTEISRAGATVPAGRLVRVHADATIDDTFTTSADQVVFAVTVQSDDKAIVGGNFTTLSSDGRPPATRSRIGRLYWDGSVEVDFNPSPSEVIGSVSAIALQPDGKMLVSGHFTSIAGQNRQRVARLNADGSLDSSFSAGANGYVGAIAVQPDGKIVVGGFFTQLSDTGGAVARQNIGRLNPDGSIDGSFAPDVSNNGVGAIAIQPDGKIIIGGPFSNVNGETRSRLARLNPDGSLDPAFNPGANNDGVYGLALQPDGKILVVGHFTTLGGGGGGTTTRNRIGRLHADGSLDAAFDPGANDSVLTVVVQPDGKIVVAGSFVWLGGGTGTTSRHHIGRLNADGSVDAGFDPGANDYIGTIGLQVDGRIVVGGRFTMLGGGGAGNTTRNFIGRLHADGSIDGSFDAGADARAHALVVLPDGKVVVSGDFATLGGGGLGTAPRPRIGRLTNTTGAFQNLSVSGDGSVVTWLRSGAAPELWRATFESSADGVTYTSLGSANRIATGWQLAGQNLPTDQNLFVRARGYVHAARSVSLVESIRHMVTIDPDVAQPFTDEVLISGVTPIRTVHITELRTRIDSQRARFGLGGFAWTDAPLTAGTIVRAVHVTELRSALQQAYAAAGLAAPTFTDPTLIPGILTIKRVHIQELRDSVVTLEGN